MRRAVVAALALLALAASASAEPARDISGAWRGETGTRTEYPPYFDATLTQQGETLDGAGVTNRCPTCRGFDEYAVRWHGSVKGDVVLLIARHIDRPWESEQHYEGRLSADGRSITGTFRNGSHSEPFVMHREREGS